MTPDEIRYRRCSIKDCPYKEFRGQHLGNFVKSRFICPTHTMAWLLGASFQFRDGAWTDDAEGVVDGER